MLFNSPEFIIFFAIAVCTVAAIKNRKFQHVFILLASYFFFYYSNNYLIVLLLYVTLLDFYLARAISNTSSMLRKKIFLVVSLGGSLGLLGFYKYADFAITQFNILGNYFDLKSNIPLLNLALPIGISFYTFHSIGYVLDVYRGNMPPSKSLREYALFVTFFPQLVAGPILRARQFIPQLREEVTSSPILLKLRQIVIEKQNLKIGLTIMAIGFFKKMFIADNVAPLVNDIISNSPQESFSSILAALAFGTQIYADFSGYSDIAIGAARILGFVIPPNFNNPYFAASPSEFWKRWHISLSSWLKDYLYIPLGGNRKSKIRTSLNIMFVMFLGGLWHGASWNFVIWGLMHGLYLVVHKTIKNKFSSLANSYLFKSMTGRILSIIVTQYFIFLAWLAFRVKDTNYAILFLKKYLIWDFGTPITTQYIYNRKFSIILMISFFVLCYISYKKPILYQKLFDLKLRYWTILITSIIILIIFFYGGNDEFIYFKF